MAFDVVEELQRAQGIGAPLIALATADQQNSLVTIGAKLSGEDKEFSKKYTPDKDDIVPVLGFDILGGIRSYNKAGKTLLDHHYKKLQAEAGDDDATPLAPSAIKQPTKMLQFIQNLGAPKANDEGTSFIMMMVNAHRFLEDVNVLQGVMNLREPFQLNRRILLMMGPSFQLPSEITQDILVIDEPLPTTEQIKTKLEKLFDDNDVVQEKDTLDKAAAALRGLAEFPIIQAASLAVRRIDNKIRVSIPDLWERKRKLINSVPGLVMEPLGGETFEDIGGLWQVKQFITDLVNGPCRPTILVYIDEIDKSVAGTGFAGGGDSSGTSQDQMQQLLTNMAEHDYFGQLNLGPAGCGKSYLATSVAATFGIPLVRMDLGAAKDGIVGSSERRIRSMFKTIYAMAGKGGAYFIATCNRLHTLSPELQRRFNFALFYFDISDRDERVAIGKIVTAKKYPTVKNDEKLWENAKGWSGANIRDCCKMAYAFNVPLEQAAKRIIPAAERDAAGIKQLREMADGKFLSATYEGKYSRIKALEIEKEEEAFIEKSGRTFKVK